MPPYHEDPRIKPAELAERVQCELKMAAASPSTKILGLDKYLAGFSLTLNAETNVNPNIAGDWTIPYHLSDTFSLGPSAGLSDTVTRESITNFGLRIDSLHSYECPEYMATAYREDAEAARITYGSFGLLDWLNGVARSAERTKYAATGKLEYTLDFVVTGTVNASPGFAITNASGTLNLPLRRTDKNTLQIALSRISPEPDPLKVCITNLPGGASCEPKAAPQKKRPGAESFIAPPAPGTQPQSRGLTPRMMEEINRNLDIMRSNTDRLRLPQR